MGTTVSGTTAGTLDQERPPAEPARGVRIDAHVHVRSGDVARITLEARGHVSDLTMRCVALKVTRRRRSQYVAADLYVGVHTVPCDD